MRTSCPESLSRGRREGPRLRLLWASATTWAPALSSASGVGERGGCRAVGLPLAFTPHGASWRTCIAGRGDGRARSRTRKGRDELKTTKAQQHWHQDPPSEVQNTAGCTPKRAGATAGRTAEPGVGPQQVRRRDEDELRPAVTHGGGAGRPGPPFHRGSGAKPLRAPHGAIITAVPRLAGPGLWGQRGGWGSGLVFQ